MIKPSTNYWVDVLIGISFLVSGISGIVFLLPGATAAGVLGVSIRTWSDLHTWSGVGMVIGVALHLALHWKWIVFMTRRMVLRRPPASATRHHRGPVVAPSPYAPATELAPVPIEAKSVTISRRSFLALGGATAFAAGLVVSGYGSSFGSSAAQPDSTQPVGAPTPQPRSRNGSPSLGSGANSQGGQATAGVSTADEASLGEQSGSADATGSGTGREEPLAGDSNESGRAGETGVTGNASDDSLPVVPDSEAALGVACRFGVVNDPYPGQCRHYVDRDGDGICDLSIPGTGTVMPVYQPTGRRR